MNVCKLGWFCVKETDESGVHPQQNTPGAGTRKYGTLTAAHLM
jgi:hypothetical protein